MLKFIDFLVENRIEWLKGQHKEPGSISTDHDPYAEHKEPHAIIDHFSTHADPTRKKTYTQWVVGQYKKGHIRQEDAPRVSETLTHFEAHKARLQNKDINQYRHIADVETAVQPHIGEVSKKEETRQIKQDGADLVHKDPSGLTVHHVKTHDAACQYGAGTRWCTAGRDPHYFNQYSAQGPLYVINTPDKQKHQFHFESGQFANAEDRMIDTKELVKKYPALRNVKAFQKGTLKSMHFHPDKDHPQILHNVLTGKDAQGHPLHPERDRVEALRHPAVKPEHVHAAVNDPSSSVQSAVAENPSLNAQHIHTLLKSRHDDVRRNVMRHPNVDDTHISVAMHDEDKNVRMKALEHPKANEKHILKGLQDSSHSVQMKAKEIQNSKYMRSLTQKKPENRVAKAKQGLFGW